MTFRDDQPLRSLLWRQFAGCHFIVDHDRFSFAVPPQAILAATETYEVSHTMVVQYSADNNIRPTRPSPADRCHLTSPPCRRMRRLTGGFNCAAILNITEPSLSVDRGWPGGYNLASLSVWSSCIRYGNINLVPQMRTATRHTSRFKN